MLSPRLKLYFALIIRNKFNADRRIISTLDLLMRPTNIDLSKGETLWALAIWGYARAIDRRGWAWFNARWAWTTGEIAQFNQSPQAQQLNGACHSLGLIFQQQNPGYSLSHVTQPRDLARQVSLFQTNPYTDRMGQAVLAQLELRIQDFPDVPAPLDVDHFWNILLGVEYNIEGHRTLTNATPGLSQHGRITAVDFLVRHGNQTVADADSSQIPTVWRGPSQWATKLKNAVTSFNTQRGHTIFDGPLLFPDEPWHFTYNTGN